MIGALTLFAALAAAPVSSFAAPGFQSANVDPKFVDSLMLHFTQQLGARGYRVSTPQDVAAVLGLERQKQLLSCADEACHMEIAAALGVDAVITGSISRIGAGLLINIKVIRANDASALAIFSGRPKSDEAALDFLEASAATFAAQYPLPGKAQATVASDAAASPPSRVLPWAVAGASVVSLGVGGVFFAASRSTAANLTAGKASDYPTLQGLAQTGRTQETLGVSLLVAGAVLGAASAGLFAWTGAPAAHAAVAPVHGGAVLTLGGAL